VSVLLDANVLLYAVVAQTPEHRVARTWLDARLADPDDVVGLCWPVAYTTVRLLTHRTVLGRNALSVARAWDVVAAVRRQPRVRTVTEGREHAAISAELAATPGLRSSDVPDVQLAALAIEHGMTLASHDNGFRRFPRLRWLDPLA
jgi:toxin-antitoxin system PIN domain toxin